MANGNHHCEQLKNFISDFQKALECPVCLDVVKKPFKQCARGHLVCVSCLGIYPCCPTCEEEFLLDNPVCIQNLLEFLPRSCRYSADGCEEMVQDENNHENFCSFRRVRCKGVGCIQNILAKGLREHLKSVHSEIPVIKERATRVIRWPRFQPGVCYNCLYIDLFDNLFCISVDNSDKGQLKIMFESFPIRKLDGDYYAKVSFAKGDISYAFTLKAFPTEETELASDEMEINKAEYFCMKVPKIMLSNFLDGNGNLMHELLIFSA